MAKVRLKPGPKPGQDPRDGPTKEPEHNKHKLGHAVTRDLVQLRTKAAIDLERVRTKILAQIESILDTDPSKVRFQELAVTYGIFTDKQTILEQGPASTTNNTIVINGLSRGQALTFLRGDVSGNGFLQSESPVLSNTSVCVDTLPTVQNEPVLVDSSSSLQS